MSNRAWVTLATNDSYGLGALVLAHSLRRVSSTHPAVVLITPSVTDAMRERLREVFAEVVIVDVLDSKDAAHLALLQRPELGITFTKIHCWGLTQYEKCVFLDADTLVVQNCDELFEREELSAAPDVGWPDCFNSGVFVYKPSSETFDALIKFAQERGSFDGGDQGLLNSYFADWARADINKHLPFLYNVTSAAFYSYLPALEHYGQNLKIIHFIGAAKPWLQQYNWETRSVDAPDHLRELLQLWWELFVGQVHHQLDTAMVEDVDVEASPALPPPDVAQHYAPRLDPESEFPWHHPDAQVPQDSQAYEHKVDLTQFHDPWQNYRGNIPPIADPEVLDDRQALRDYAWDYQPSQELISNMWQQSSSHGSHNPTEHHNKPTHDHHHSHSHSERSWGNHSHEQSHGNWHQEHEAGHFFTSHEHPVHSEPEHVHEHGYHEHSHSEYPHDHHYDHKSHHYHDHSFHEQSQHDESSTESQNDHRVIHQDFNHTQVEYITNRSHLHIVHHLHVDYDSIPNEREEEDMPITINGVNGDSSETDRGDYEDIKPRHPYDNYYLKHRATIDSYGRKICSHEIPPSPSPSPPPEATYADSPSLEEIDAPSEVENQSGVAGNLARVVPGATQREALDELTRRQGWEAGNIDYMGADSFDNIWAKISQTLNQPRSSPPKEPTPPPKLPSPPKELAAKQPSPPKEAPPVEAKPDTSVEEKPSEVPVEAAVEAAGKEIPVTPVAAPAAAPAPAPTEASVPAPAPVAPAPVAPAPVAPAPVAPAPVAPAPVAPAPVVPAPVAPAPVVPAPVAPAPVAPAAIKSAAVEAPAAVQASAEVEASAPVKAAAPAVPAPALEALVKVEAAAPVEAAKKSTEKTDKVPATPPATPKTTPEPSTPVSEEPPAVATPEKALEASAASSDSPPLANTPSKEQAPAPPAAKSEERERRKPAGKLRLSPPAAADPLATPDSELEDAAALASSIIAGELRTPTVSAATPPAPASPAGADAAAARLAVREPELPTPPVSLAQIGVKPKGKTTAAQIESSVTEPAAPDAPPAPASPGAPDAPREVPKKKIVKKTAKKEGDAPVPPPRKKEKKPKDK